MGDKISTIQNLEIIKSDLENNLIFLKGSVPGSKNSIVLIQKNAKKINRITTLEKYKKIQEQLSGAQTKVKAKSKTPEKKEANKKKTESKPASPTSKPASKEVKK